MSIYIIAEAGASHNGDIKTARELILAAKLAGADCVKFQAWNTEKFVAKTSPFYESFKNNELQNLDWIYLKYQCDQMGIDFLASAFNVEMVDFLDDIGMKAFKVASGDLTYEPLLRHIGSKGKPIYLSTGMGTVEEISNAVNWLGRIRLVLLKCTVDYPSDETNVNLAGIRTLGSYFPGHQIGLSDHTKGHLAACMAVSMGAVVIEKHFALEETGEAISAADFNEFVKKVRTAESIMGSAELGTFDCEKKWKSLARRGKSGLRE